MLPEAVLQANLVAVLQVVLEVALGILEVILDFQDHLQDFQLHPHAPVSPVGIPLETFPIYRYMCIYI